MDYIPIGQVGTIIAGDYSGWEIIVDETPEGGKSYTISWWSPGKTEGYDRWVESYERLQLFFTDEDFQVEWTKES
jgi:hypothetical protein